MKVNFVEKNVQGKKSNLKTSADLRLRSFDLNISLSNKRNRRHSSNSLKSDKPLA